MLLPFLPVDLRNELTKMWKALLTLYDQEQINGVSPMDFRRRLLKLQRACHPDKHAGADPLFQGQMTEFSVALNLLLEHL